MPGPRDNQVLEAVRTGDVETLRRHLDSGGNPNLRGSSGQLTLLQIAAQGGNLEAVMELTKCKDCRKNEKSSKNGDTALIIAVKRGHVQVTRHLITLGDCDLNVQNHGGFTALMKSAKRGVTSTLLLLLQHGADLELTSRSGGHTALTLAVASQKPKAVELLLQFGASLEHKTLSGKTAFDIAWELKSEDTESSRRQEIIENLVEARNLRQDIKRDTGFPTDVLNGQYKIVEVIGSGSFGCVFLTDNLRSQNANFRTVVKAMKLKSNRRTAEINSDGLHEAKLMLQIDHPQVVKIIQYFTVDKNFCIAMEYCEFGDLDAWIGALARKHRQFPSDTAMHWFLQMLLALSYLHSNGIMHRDLKPKNIFIKQDGTAKIGDFGLSRRLLGTGDYASTIAGTVVYMCPEILCNVNRPKLGVAEVPIEGYDTKCDIWSLGCTLYELCTCKLLFDVDDVKEAVCGSSSLPELPSRYPDELNSLFQQMMIRQRKNRATCKQLFDSKIVRSELARMKELGCDADVRFLQENCHLLKITDVLHRRSSFEEDGATLTASGSGGGNQLLWQAVDGALQGRNPTGRNGPNYDLQDDSITDTVPESIFQALEEHVKFGFPLELIYRRFLVSLELPPEERRVDYAKFTDNLDACELVETLVVCEMTK